MSSIAERNGSIDDPQQRLWVNTFERFVSASQTGGKLLAKELSSHPSQRVMRPVNAKGNRFIVNGITFQLLEEDIVPEDLVQVATFTPAIVGDETQFSAPFIGLVEASGNKFIAAATTKPSALPKAPGLPRSVSSVSASRLVLPPLPPPTINVSSRPSSPMQRSNSNLSDFSTPDGRKSLIPDIRPVPLPSPLIASPLPPTPTTPTFSSSPEVGGVTLQDMMVNWTLSFPGHGTSKEEVQQKYPDDGAILKYFLNVLMGYLERRREDEEHDELAASNSQSNLSTGSSQNSRRNSIPSSSIPEEEPGAEVRPRSVDSHAPPPVFPMPAIPPPPIFDEEEEDFETERCSADGCLNIVEAKGLCKDHRNKRESYEKAEEAKVMEFVKTGEFFRKVTKLFSQPDSGMHGLAVRVVYLTCFATLPPALAAERFSTTMTTLGGAGIFNSQMSEAFLWILLGTEENIARNLNGPIKTAFYMPIRHPEVWTPLLACMRECPFLVRQHTLQELTTVLYNSWANTQSLVEHNKGWQSALFNLFIDLPVERKEGIKLVFSLIANIFTLVHHQYYMQRHGIAQTLRETLRHLHAFADYTDESCTLASTLLYSLCKKLTSDSGLFPPTYEAQHPSWANVLPLLDLIRWFVFQTPFWKTDDISAESKSKEDDSSPRAFRREKEKEIEKKKSKYCLVKKRVTAPFPEIRGDSEKVTNYGVHFDFDGHSGDLQLVQAVVGLLKSLRVEDIAIEVQQPDSKEGKTEHPLVKELAWWNDTLEFLSMLNARAVTELKILTYRKISSLAKRLVTLRHKTSKDRESIRSDLSKVYKQLAKEHGFG